MIAMVLFGLDKFLAIKGKCRIKEKYLITSALFFGAIGAYLAMYLFHHKTHKIMFNTFIPLFCIIQVVSIIMLYNCI